LRLPEPGGRGSVPAPERVAAVRSARVAVSPTVTAADGRRRDACAVGAVGLVHGKGSGMDISTLARFFMWCTILSGGTLVLSSLVLVCGGDWVYRVHSRLFPMPRESFNVAIYRFLGWFKIAVIVCHLVPWVALEIIR
jgi:hypothetical protein